MPVGIPDARFRRMSKIAGSVARCCCDPDGNVLKSFLVRNAPPLMEGRPVASVCYGTNCAGRGRVRPSRVPSGAAPLHREPAVDGPGLARDVVAVVGGEERGEADDLLRLAGS